MTAAPFMAASRIDGMGVSEILTRTDAALALRRQVRPVVILGAGEPDFDTPEHVKEAAARAMAEGRTNCTAADGAPELKEAVRAKFAHENGLQFSLDQITCGAGAKQMLFGAMMATLEPGDEVLIPAPYRTSDIHIVRIAGGVPVVPPCEEDAGFLLAPCRLGRGDRPMHALAGARFAFQLLGRGL